jgi:hypothetical protein
MHNYTVTRLNTFEQMFLQMRSDLVEQPVVNVGEWQSQHKDTINMHELLHVVFDMPIPEDADQAAQITGARMPWAEDHFLERVSGQPLNPSPSERWWPFREKKDGDTNTSHKSEGEAFSHTYPERMWPKLANGGHRHEADYPGEKNPHWGIRFEYGDLMDVVNQLVKTPLTRQAYLPIWFPEDTGVVHGKRVPCTLGYHFIIREGKLDVSYFMRSTDLLRHFQDDVYLALRLAQWVVEQYNQRLPDHERQYPLDVGTLVFHTANLHIFDQDAGMIDWWKKEGKTWF